MASAEADISRPAMCAELPAQLSPPRRRDRVVTAAGLLVAPLLLLWPLRAAAFAHALMIDPYLHTALVQHGRDLLERFGYDNRQFARAGFTVPGRLANMLFGDIGGYYALRYVLVLVAILPAFLLFRRVRGNAAGAVVVASILASPVIVRAWSTDYPDASAVSYLIAACCCAAYPAPTKARGLACGFAAGAFLSLAVNSNFIAAPLALCVVVAYSMPKIKRTRALLRDVGAVCGGVALTVVVLCTAAWSLFGSADIYTPTWNAFKALRSPEQIAVNHSSNWRWVLDVPHVAVPLTVLLLWGALYVRRSHRFSSSEVMLWWMLLLQSAAFGVMQFWLDEQVLEFHFYFSMLWAATVLVLASAACEIGRALLSRRRTAWAVALTVLAVPIAFSAIRAPTMGLLSGLLIGVLVVLATQGLLVRETAWRAAAALGCTAICVHAVTVGQSAAAPLRGGQAVFPKPQYALVYGHAGRSELDRYAVISDLHEEVPPPRRRGRRLVMWAADDWSETASIAAAQYGWLPNVVQGLPELTPEAVARIRAVDPDVVVMLADDGSSLSRAMQQLRTRLPNARPRGPVRLHHGGVSLYVDVARLE